MRPLTGSVRFAAPDGDEITASAGDLLVVPNGARVGWESTERFCKFYAVQDVDA